MSSHPITMRELDSERFSAALVAIPGAIAVTLGGSRAVGRERRDSDWDFGVYYREHLDTDALRRLVDETPGVQGEVFEPGDWAGFMHGGAFLEVEGHKVDVLYRKTSEVKFWTDEAAAGRFEIDRVPGYLAGMASYVLAGELALGLPLQGSVPASPFPAALRENAPPRWRWEADFALQHARMHADRSDAATTNGFVTQALLALGQARMAEAGEWVLNEKDLLVRSALAPAAKRYALIQEQHGLDSALQWLSESI